MTDNTTAAIARALSDVLLGKAPTTPPPLPTNGAPGTVTTASTMAAKRAAGHLAELFGLRRLDPEVGRKMDLLLALAAVDNSGWPDWADPEMLSETAFDHVTTAPIEQRLTAADVYRARAGDPDPVFAARLLAALTVANPEPTALTLAVDYLQARKFKLAPATAGEETTPAS